MNWTMVAGKWKQLTGDIKSTWGKITDDDVAAIDGKREKLLGVLQERYGIAREEAEKQADSFLARLQHEQNSQTR